MHRLLSLVVVVLSVIPLAAAPLVYKHAGLPPEKAAASMTVPEGFAVTLFAGEPDVHQPIALCLDDRGRLWVAEAYSYPIRRSDKEARDRILIFEDTDGDGRFDKRTVFLEGLNLVSGLEVGFGGVWIGAAPYLLFVPIKPGEDKPAGKPRILLDGWHYEDTHETLNAFRWGPDGWLYGCHGVFTHSRVGKPGTPDKDRIPINAGVWRYHPTKHVLEVFAHGSSNPWGLDFDAHGQAFITACVIPHAYHIIQGGRYQRQAGSHFNPHTYADIRTIADHLHWGGGDWTSSRGGEGAHDTAGGGHAHCGLMIYQGGAWPDEYRGHMFMGNVHGHRLNMDVLKPKSSGFVASHGPDFLLANDAWARFINLRYGPDGNVYLLDWYDKQACHHGDPNIWDRCNGRIYKISYRGTNSVSVDLGKKNDRELVDLLLHKNEWFVRHALRLLQERAADKKLDAEIDSDLSKIAFQNKNEMKRLRGFWALHVTGGLTEEAIHKALDDKAEHVRGWAVQLALEDGKASEMISKKLAEMAVQDASPVVRLYLASGMQRLPLPQRWDVLQGLLTHSEDAGDHNLPLMYWYSLEPLAGASPERALRLASAAKASPLLLPFTARRIVSAGTPEALSMVVKALANENGAGKQLAVLRAIHEALKGRRRVEMPSKWSAAYVNLSDSKDAEVRRQATTLAVIFGDAKAFADLRRVLSDSGADATARQGALTALLDAHDTNLAPILQKLLDDKALRSPALRGLAFYDDPKTPGVILQVFSLLPPKEKRDALNTLASRVSYGKALMEAIAAKKVSVSEVPAEIVRQLRNLHDKALDDRIAQVWGIVRTTPADRAKLIAAWKKKLTASAPAPDLSLGRATYAKTCQQCHTLYGEGGKVGPDITGSNRANLDYLLENILDPSAVIPNDYKMTVLTLKSGRVISGIVRAETAAAITVVTANETLTVPVNEVEEQTPSSTSMMPDDLLKPLSEDEVRALVAYLRHPRQVPMSSTNRGR
jgi:putative membrane-bound dehydrogenase-like protein